VCVCVCVCVLQAAGACHSATEDACCHCPAVGVSTETAL